MTSIYRELYYTSMLKNLDNNFFHMEVKDISFWHGKNHSVSWKQFEKAWKKIHWFTRGKIGIVKIWLHLVFFGPRNSNFSVFLTSCQNVRIMIEVQYYLWYVFLIFLHSLLIAKNLWYCHTLARLWTFSVTTTPIWSSTIQSKYII